MMIHFTQNDTGPRLIGDTNANLTGATVELHFRQPYGAGILTRAATITDAPNGVWEYVWATGELDPVGMWTVEAQVTFSSNEIQTFGPAAFRVEPEIA